jgi:hypothetical protein
MTTLPVRTLVLRDQTFTPFGFLRLAPTSDSPLKGDCLFDITPDSPEQARRSEVRWLHKRHYRRYSEHKFVVDDAGVYTIRQGGFELVLTPDEHGNLTTTQPAPPVTATWDGD